MEVLTRKPPEAPEEYLMELLTPEQYQKYKQQIEGVKDPQMKWLLGLVVLEFAARANIEKYLKNSPSELQNHFSNILPPFLENVFSPDISLTNPAPETG